MSVAQNKGFWQLGPDGTVNAAGGGGGSALTMLSYDDKISETKPAGISGTITMSGDVWQCRGFDNGSSRFRGMGQGWTIEYAVPTGIMDGAGKALETWVIFDTDPSNNGKWSARVGFLIAGSVGIGNGLEHTGTAGAFRASTGLLSTTDVGVSCIGNLSEGMVRTPGDWNGTNTVQGSGSCDINTATGAASAAGDSNSGGGTYNRANVKMVVHFGYTELVAGGLNDFDVRIGYRVVDRRGT